MENDLFTSIYYVKWSNYSGKRIGFRENLLKTSENYSFGPQIWGCPVNVPLNQSNEQWLQEHDWKPQEIHPVAAMFTFTSVSGFRIGHRML